MQHKITKKEVENGRSHSEYSPADGEKSYVIPLILLLLPLRTRYSEVDLLVKFVLWLRTGGHPMYQR